MQLAERAEMVAAAPMSSVQAWTELRVFQFVESAAILAGSRPSSLLAYFELRVVWRAERVTPAEFQPLDRYHLRWQPLTLMHRRVRMRDGPTICYPADFQTSQHS